MSCPGWLRVAPTQRDCKVGGICLKGVASIRPRNLRPLTQLSFQAELGTVMNLALFFPNYESNMGSMLKNERKENTE